VEASHLSLKLLHVEKGLPALSCWLNQHQDLQSECHSEDSLIRGCEELREFIEKFRDLEVSCGRLANLPYSPFCKIYGRDVANAAFQAIIWYPEQELHKSHGVSLKVISQDYSGAIRMIRKNEGITDEKVETAIATGELGSGLARQMARVTDTTTGGLTSTVPVETRTLNDEGRASFLTSTPVAIARVWNPSATDPNLNSLQAKFTDNFEAIKFARQ
jgi:hypothetical protein